MLERSRICRLAASGSPPPALARLIVENSPDLPTAAAGLGVDTRFRRLAAAEDGQDALLLPLMAGGFRAVVDPEPARRERHLWDLLGRAAPGAVQRFRLAHELAHSFFYDDGAPPRRTRSATAAEEFYCDSFAAAAVIEFALDGPPDVDLGDILDLAVAAQTTVEAVAIYVASRSPGTAVAAYEAPFHRRLFLVGNRAATEPMTEVARAGSLVVLGSPVAPAA